MSDAKPSKNAQQKSDVSSELRKLTELAVTYPEIGPTVASLALKLGEKEIGERLLRMASEGDAPSVEYHFVAAQTARREGRFADCVEIARKAVEEVAAVVDKVPADDLQRLLHLTRLGYAVALFDIKDTAGAGSLAETFKASADALEGPLGQDHFYRSLLAQALWYTDKDGSEAEWDKAVGLTDPEAVWNARGTWYKDADKDLKKAEKAYRSGLEQCPESALLLHNVAQVLVDTAEQAGDDHKRIRRLLNQADDLLRRALRGEAPRLRRHIHATRDRLFELKRKLPAPPQGGKGKGKGRGPGPRKNGAPSRGRGNQDRDRGDRFQREGKVSLGDVILHKLQEQEKDKR